MGNLGFEPNDVEIVANKKFLDENPVIKRFFELLSIPMADIDAQELKMHSGESTDADIERQAQAWIKAHQSEWNHWLAEAKKAGS
jgi:glycine betaine/proline transport system substrate-binding protein